MTEDLIKELIDIVKTFKEIDTCCAILSGIFTIAIIAYLVIEISIMKKKKKWIQEYKATLTKEQLKSINDYKELTK